MRFGIDLGGTKIEIIALANDGSEKYRKRVDTPKHDYRGTVESIRGLVDDAEKATGEMGSVGIGIPGAISPATGLVKNANSVWLNRQPFDKDLTDAIGHPIRIANDADCLALSEAMDGAGEGAPIVWAVILGTGAGSGLVAHGNLVTGPNAIGGEWGHNPLPWATSEEAAVDDCFCGKKACIERFVSGTGLERDYLAHTDTQRTARDISALAKEGDTEATAAMDRYIDRLARATACVINIIDPHVVVLGGGMSNNDRIYDELPGIWDHYVFSDTVRTKLAKAHHGDSSGVRGAAWLWPKDGDQK